MRIFQDLVRRTRHLRQPSSDASPRRSLTHRLGVALGLLGLAVIYLGSLLGCQVVISRKPSARAVPTAARPTATAQVSIPSRRSLPATSTPVPPMATPLPPTPTTVPRAAHSPPTRVVAPAIGLDAPVIPVGWHLEKQNGKTVSVWDVASFAAGWHKNSAYPGQQGNVVLSGHHNIDGEVFRHVVELKPGDRVTLFADNVPYVYEVTLRLIIPEKGVPPAQRQQNARWIGPTRDSRLTLVTCWPYTGNTHRVIVVAKLVGNSKFARRN